MFTVYILKSKVKARYYIGYTENLKKRLEYHNDGKVKSTKAYRPWEVIYQETFAEKAEAFNREQQIKYYKGSEAFKKLIENSERWQSG